MNEQDEIKYILATSTPKNDNKISPKNQSQPTNINIDKSIKISGNHINILSRGFGILLLLLLGMIFF